MERIEPMFDASGLELVVRRVSRAAERIKLYELRRRGGEAVPAFEPGAHIDLHLPQFSRSYSIVSSPDDLSHYLIAVALSTPGRGGSRWIHTDLAEGTAIRASRPRNLFPLDEDAPASVFIAGGIGITPILPMLRHLDKGGRPWTLHYAVRSRGEGAFLAELDELAARSGAGQVHLYIGDEAPPARLSIENVVAGGAAGRHFYCCGPDRMLTQFETAAARVLPPAQVHVERFGSVAAPEAMQGFSVHLARSGLELDVPPGRSILDVVRDAGVDAPSSCEQGVCGACETAVLEGIPDHQDLILSTAEKAANAVMMICCSRAKTDRLVLDL